VCVSRGDVHWIQGSGLPNGSTVGHNTLLTGGTDNFDASLSKAFPMGEKTRIEFRWEAQNAFNHPQFTQVPEKNVFGSPASRFLNRDFTVEELRDEDLRWAGLVMISAMHAQRADAVAVLARARSLGRRTFIGGPWASSEPELLLLQADHVLAGEAEEVFVDIAAALERGTARRLYRVSDKPDMTRSPVPRYDLIRLDKYKSMPVQFSRGCPFQCEFCDIITIYGRQPRSWRGLGLVGSA
jgi:hypothetical protein